MDFVEVIEQAKALLRLTYRTLKRQFALDEEALEDLKQELLYSQAQQVREEGLGLVWTGEAGAGESGNRKVGEGEQNRTAPTPDSWTEKLNDSQTERLNDPAPRPPAAYTPAHLADRIRAVTVTDGERKTITALFADLKGSTALIEGLDPEEARAIIDPALQLMMDAVH